MISLAIGARGPLRTSDTDTRDTTYIIIVVVGWGRVPRCENTKNADTHTDSRTSTVVGPKTHAVSMPYVQQRDQIYKRYGAVRSTLLL